MKIPLGLIKKIATPLIKKIGKEVIKSESTVKSKETAEGFVQPTQTTKREITTTAAKALFLSIIAAAILGMIGIKLEAWTMESFISLMSIIFKFFL